MHLLRGAEARQEAVFVANHDTLETLIEELQNPQWLLPFVAR